jgi:hypothetical protein
MKAMPIQLNIEILKRKIKDLMRNELLKGYKIGMMSMSDIVSEKLKNVNSKNYKSKINDVLKSCNWTKSDDFKKNNMQIKKGEDNHGDSSTSHGK